MTLPAGTRLGPYEVLAELGAGGMGVVYRARDTRLRREVAVKVLPASFSGDPERLRRFEEESRAAGSLNHPNIVAIYDVGDQDGAPFVVTELLEGETLRERLADGPLPTRKAVEYSVQIASGLAAAHEAGIVHRDLKPENLMVTRDGRVKILDFGLAKLSPPPSVHVSEMPTAAVATEPGTLLGTVSYMSPEQARGLSVDHRSDLFSLGAVLYELVSGRRPFSGATSADTLSAILREDPPPLPPSVSPALDRIVRRCLEKSPAERFQSARDFGFALEAVSGLSGIEPAPATLARQRRGGGAISALVLAAAAFVAGWFLRPALWSNRIPSIARVARVTAGPAKEFGAVLSPDGKWVAYLSDARGPVDIWVRFLAGGEPANLTERIGLTVQRQADIGGLDISPDGSLIAFDAGPSGAADSPASAPPTGAAGSVGSVESWVIPAPLGGTPRRLIEKGHAARWSPDGRSIVFVRAGSTLGDGLCVADADGGNVREILTPSAGLHVHWPAWSADGRIVYFIRGITSWNLEPAEIYRVPASGGEAEPVVRTSRRAVHPAPTRSGLFYAANPDTADLALWWRPLSGGEAIRLTTGLGAYAEPRVSADGRSVVATLVEAKQSLISLPVRFSSPPLARDLTDGYFGDIDPAFSPTADRLVWSTARAGNRNLWIGAADGSGARPLTTGPAFDERPAFSPDGRRVAFVSDRGGSRGIWLVAADGGAPTLVAAAQVIDTLTWSPDGSEIVFAAPAGNLPGLFRVSLAKGQVSKLPTRTGAYAPAWSPDGRAVAFIEIAPGEPARLQFVDPQGRPMPLLRTEAMSFANGLIAWCADSRRLIAAALPGALDASLWLVEPGSTEPLRRIATFPVATRIRGIAASPDGATVVLGRYQPSSDIVLFTMR